MVFWRRGSREAGHGYAHRYVHDAVEPTIAASERDNWALGLTDLLSYYRVGGYTKLESEREL